MYPKRRPLDPTMKIQVFPFQIGKNLIDKISLLEFASFGQMWSTISSRLVKKIVIIVCFVPMTCRVLA
jgi:hypothetical protein